VTDAERLARLLEEIERDRTTVMELVCATRTPEPWRLYPGESGIFSRKTRSQFYFHTHGGDRDEAGHFHTVRLFPDRTAHLVAISMAPGGWPRALFTVNRWAIGDAEETAESLERYARRFLVEESRGDPRVIRFVNLMFRVFLPEIERLQDMKAAALRAYRLAHPGTNPFEDRSLEVLSHVEIDVRNTLLAAGAAKGGNTREAVASKK
jgi:hypothetical protein